MSAMTKWGLCSMLLLPWAVGCGGAGGPASDAANRSFSLAWSEYPSWSVFGVAHEKDLINKEAGQMGSLERKWNIDIVLQQLDYDSCILAYGSSNTDGVCITNMDVLAPALARDSVAILPTSTSYGADACLVRGIDSLDDLAGKPSYGLEKSVSQYMFERCLEERGKSPADFPFKQMDPGAAAQAMQSKQENINSIVVWNPFVMQTEKTLGGDVKRLFDSKEIPEEIIDMIVIGQDVLRKPGGESFAAAVAEAFYTVNKMLESETSGDDTLVALGEKFSNLGLEDMKQVVQETKFYKNPNDGIGLFEKESFQQVIMPKVVDFCVTHDIVESKPTLAFSASEPAKLRFESKYMRAVNADSAMSAGALADQLQLDEPVIEVDSPATE